MVFADKFVRDFKTMENPVPSSVMMWMGEHGEHSGPAFIALAQALIQRRAFVEAFWVLTAYRAGIEEPNSIRVVEQMLSVIHASFMEHCVKWLGGELVCGENELFRLRRNLEDNLSLLIREKPLLCSALFHARRDRQIGIVTTAEKGLPTTHAHFTLQFLDLDNQPCAGIQPVSETIVGRDLGELGGICIIGAGSGIQVKDLFQRTEIDFPNFEVGLHVIEPSFTILKAILAMHDMRALLKAGRVFWYVGFEGLMDFETALADESQFPVCRNLSFDPSVSTFYTPRINTLIREKAVKQSKLQKCVAETYRGRSDEEWREIYNGKRPLRVLGFTSLFTSFLQYCMRDILDGFKQMGCETALSIEKGSVLRCSNLYQLDLINEFKPDLIMCISYNRSNLNLQIPAGIPYICWQQDIMPHNLQPSTKNSIGKTDFLVGAAYNRGILLENGYPEEKVKKLGYWPTNTMIYRPLRPGPGEMEKYGCDISYVSHGSEPAEVTFENYRARMRGVSVNGDTEIVQKLISSYYDLIEERFRAWRDHPVSRSDHDIILDGLCREFSLELPAELREDIAYMFYQYIGKHFFRLSPLERLSEKGVDLALYGKGWENHPRLSGHARGIAQNGEHLNLIYNCSSIAYHAIHAKTLHSRVMDAAAARTLFMVMRLKHDPDPVHAVFTPGEEFIYCDTPDELYEKVSHCLRHPEEIERIAENGYRKVQEYGYKAFAGSLISIIAEDPSDIRVREPEGSRCRKVVG